MSEFVEFQKECIKRARRDNWQAIKAKRGGWLAMVGVHQSSRRLWMSEARNPA